MLVYRHQNYRYLYLYFCSCLYKHPFFLKKKIYYFDELINDIKSEKEEQKKNKIIEESNYKLIGIDDELNSKVLCEGCKEKKVEKLITKCGNEEMAKLLYESKLNSDYIYYIRWIPFSEFGNIEYLAKGGFGEVSKAKWIGHDDYSSDVVLKRIYNSSNNILDILKEVNKKFNVDIDLKIPCRRKFKG